jgi:hypothetical protein
MEGVPHDNQAPPQSTPREGRVQTTSVLKKLYTQLSHPGGGQSVEAGAGSQAIGTRHRWLLPQDELFQILHS